jgi:hypothetical protein
MNIDDPKFTPQINEELQSFLPEHKSDELEQLEENCKSDPDHELMPPIQIWAADNSIIDGHHQFKIRRKLGLAIKYVELSFQTIEDVMIYMTRIQFGRRNLNPSQRALLVAKARRYAPGRPSSNAQAVGKSLDELAAMAGVSKRSLGTASKVEAAGADSVVNGVLNGNFAVSDAANVVELPKADQEQIVEQAKATGQTLTKTKRISEARSRSGQEIVNSRVRKETLAIIGKLWRTLRKLGIQAECEAHMEAIEALIRNAGELVEEKNKVPF